MSTMTATQSAFLKYEESEFNYSRDNITVVSGQNLAAGTVLGKITASGKYAAYDNDAADGTQAAAGVLLSAVDASGADAAGVAVVRHAVVATEALVWGAGVTTQGEKDAAYADFKAIGIVARTAV